MQTIKKGLKPKVYYIKLILIASYNNRLNKQVNKYFKADLVLDSY